MRRIKACAAQKHDFGVTESAVFVAFPAAIHSLFRRNVIGSSLDLNQKPAESF
jgi:hypothetical protein